MTAIQDMTFIPIGNASDAQSWIAYDGLAGVCLITVDSLTLGRRAIRIMAQTKGFLGCADHVDASFETAVDTTINLTPIIYIDSSSPRSGKDLLDCVIQRIKEVYEAGPLCFARGDYREMIQLINDFDLMLMKFNPNNRGQFIENPIPCFRYADDDDAPRLRGPSIYAKDVLSYFRPAAEPGLKKSHVTIERHQDRHFGRLEATGHDYMEATRNIIAFYEKAIPVLGLTPQNIALRTEYLGFDITGAKS